MGRFSPTVGPYTGPTVGEALSDALNRVWDRREQEKERGYQHERQSRQDELANALGRVRLDDEGVRFGEIPEESDRTITMPQMQEPADDLAGALKRGMSVGGENEVAGSIFDKPIGLNATPGFNPNAPPPLASVPLGTFDRHTGAFNRGEGQARPEPTAQLPSRYRPMGHGAYRDTYETPVARKRDEASAERAGRHEDRLAEILAEGEQRRAAGGGGEDRVSLENLQHQHRMELERERQRRSTLGGSRTSGGGVAAARALQPAADERKAAALYAMAADAASLVDKYEPNLAAKEASRIPVIGNIVGGKVDEGTQLGQQAAFQLADAYMRYISGAAVPEQEVRRYMQTFTPQPGDTQATLDRKRQARSVMLSSLKHAGGRAMGSPPPNAPGTDGPFTQQVPVATDSADQWAAEYLKRKRGVKP